MSLMSTIKNRNSSVSFPHPEYSTNLRILATLSYHPSTTRSGGSTDLRATKKVPRSARITLLSIKAAERPCLSSIRVIKSQSIKFMLANHWIYLFNDVSLSFNGDCVMLINALAEEEIPGSLNMDTFSSTLYTPYSKWRGLIMTRAGVL